MLTLPASYRCEMMFPLFSVLKESQFEAPNVNMVLLHLKRKHLMEWVRSVMATTLGVQPGHSLPPIWMQDEAGNAFSQISQPLEGVPPDVWVRACPLAPLPSCDDQPAEICLASADAIARCWLGALF